MFNFKERIIDRIKANPYVIIYWLAKYSGISYFSDYVFLKTHWHLHKGYPLDLKNPRTFNEKLQWIKLYDRNPQYTTMVDKYAAKKYVTEILGGEYIIPTLGIWDSFDEIDFDALPHQFVLKCTHDSSDLVICRDKSKLNMEEAREKMTKGLHHNYYKAGREWPYKNVPRRIIAEKFMEDDTSHELRDYKFFCFGGQCRCFKVDFDRFVGHFANYYDPDGNILDFGEELFPPQPTKHVDLPSSIPDMIKLAESLSRSIPFLRVDFYDVNGKIYFGELTFFPSSGYGELTSKEWDLTLGEWIALPDKSGEGGYIINLESVVVLFNPHPKSQDLRDYKFFCFNGNPKYCQVIADRSTKETIDFYDMNWKHQDFIGLNPKVSEHSKEIMEKPKNFEKMVLFSKKLSQNIPFVRVDFYNIGGKIYFGELTFFPADGMGDFSPSKWNKIMGDYIDLSIVKPYKRI